MCIRDRLYCLACEYNDAYLAVEANFSTYVNTVLAQWGYANLHVRETEDTYTGRLRKSYGFLTTAKNRNLIIAELVTAVRGSLELIHDARTLEDVYKRQKPRYGTVRRQRGARRCVPKKRSGRSSRESARYANLSAAHTPTRTESMR